MEAQGIARAAYEDRLRFETLISDLSARFINLPAIKVNREIDRALQEVTEFFDADRCGILEVFGDQKVARLIHAWYAEGVRQVSPGTNCASGFSWSFERLVVHKQPIIFNRLSDLPRDAQPDMPAYQAMSTGSTCMIPLFTGEKVRYIVVLQTMEGGRALSAEYAPRLRLLAEILVNAMERNNAEEQIRKALEEVQHLRDRLQQENLHLHVQVKELQGRSRIVGQGPAIRRVLAQMEQVAPTPSTVLLLGETGPSQPDGKTADHASGVVKRYIVRADDMSLPYSVSSSLCDEPPALNSMS